MNRTISCFASVTLIVLLCSAANADDVLLAGAATADLTPGEGVSLDGPISKPGHV